MKTECLSFTQIPHSTPLFTDFLSYSPKVKKFYPHSPFFNQWLKHEASQLKYDSERRQSVSSILERHNQYLGASEKTLANIGSEAVGKGEEGCTR